jgi:hypothetical protein
VKSAALVALLFLAACDDEIVTLDVTAPSNSVELVPGGTVDFAWTLSTAAELRISATPIGVGSGPLIFDEDVPAGDGAFPWVGVDIDAVPLPPDVYDVELEAIVDGLTEDSTVRSITVHGIYFTDPAPGDTVTVTASHDVKVTTVSSRPLDLTFSLVGATEIVFDTRSIGGEFVPFDRTVAFTGTDATGAAVPAGTYTVVVDATDNDALDYRVEGGTIDWQPL